MVQDTILNKPKRALTAYNIFFRDQRQKILANGNSGGFARLAQTIAARWKLITKEDYANYLEKARDDKVRYEREMENWRKQSNSLALNGSSSFEKQRIVQEIQRSIAHQQQSAQQQISRDTFRRGVGPPTHAIEGQTQIPQARTSTARNPAGASRGRGYVDTNKEALSGGRTANLVTPYNNNTSISHIPNFEKHSQISTTPVTRDGYLLSSMSSQQNSIHQALLQQMYRGRETLAGNATTSPSHVLLPEGNNESLLGRGDFDVVTTGILGAMQQEDVAHGITSTSSPPTTTTPSSPLQRPREDCPDPVFSPASLRHVFETEEDDNGNDLHSLGQVESYDDMDQSTQELINRMLKGDA